HGRAPGELDGVRRRTLRGGTDPRRDDELDGDGRAASRGREPPPLALCQTRLALHRRVSVRAPRVRSARQGSRPPTAIRPSTSATRTTMNGGFQTPHHGPTPARELGGALRARLAAARFPLSRGARDEIKRQVREFAAELKDLGLPPERVVVAVKQAASDAGIRPCPSVLASRRCGDARTNLLVDVVSWCIAGYYDPPKR